MLIIIQMCSHFINIFIKFDLLIIIETRKLNNDIIFLSTGY